MWLSDIALRSPGTRFIHISQFTPFVSTNFIGTEGKERPLFDVGGPSAFQFKK
ncbi:hypothetical protein LOAG_09994 [Loa loa]|uniref:Uncharacterized protein n=1 Tax=Loa loa TaxID=7209 RepID=A0A1S0TQY3_LOALO|nr:hypothetical protein LOAG_09994 [Loa loa]EFO18500.2 hypothetical protein LOAG_09994 [Loa loa]